MKRTGCSPRAAVMGLLLSSIADAEFIRMLQLHATTWYWAFATRPLAASILGLFILTFVRSASSRYVAGKPVSAAIEE
jgi:hypothetical protein